jgi:hypothetical protein
MIIKMMKNRIGIKMICRNDLIMTLNCHLDLDDLFGYILEVKAAQEKACQDEKSQKPINCEIGIQAEGKRMPKRV